MTSQNLSDSSGMILKDKILFILILILVVGFFLVSLSAQHTINGYKKAYNSCVEEINRQNTGYLDVWNRDIINVSQGGLNVSRLS
jgi:hypothetical protein